MDQLLLTFEDPHLEKRFREGLLASIRAMDVQWISMVVRTVALFRVRAVMRSNGVEMDCEDVVKCVLMLALPFMERLAQGGVAMDWFLKHWLNVRFVLGLVQIALSGSFIQLLTQTDAHGMQLLPIYDLACSGVLIHFSLLTRHRVGLHLYLVLSICASAMWHAIAMSLFTKRVLKSGSHYILKIMDMMLQDRAVAPFHDGATGGTPDVILCQRAFTFIHLFIGMVCMPYGAWRLERRSRMKFIASLEGQEGVVLQGRLPRVRALGNPCQQISGFAMLLVLTWRLSAIVHPLPLP